jgi:hypothetical protein
MEYRILWFFPWWFGALIDGYSLAKALRKGGP